MYFAAEQIQIASLISKRVQELAAGGLDDVTLFGEMAEYMPGFKRLDGYVYKRRNGRPLRVFSRPLPLWEDP